MSVSTDCEVLAMSSSDVKALPAAARGCHVGIAKLEALVQPLTCVVQFHSEQVGQTVAIHDHFHAVRFEHLVALADCGRRLYDVCEPRAACLFHAHTQSFACAFGSEKASNAARGTFSQGKCHRCVL